MFFEDLFGRDGIEGYDFDVLMFDLGYIIRVEMKRYVWKGK